ncbi:hypothetical protein GY45DRAFT_1354872 [Cubamyces sp. BRFM 1775]|nr:hypothetical protein GY45DRAFT_1354872 [Cubamyces sp. BRFM 1775]
MPVASSSSTAASDALTNLTRAATVAFTAVQEQARAEAAQLRAERDDAIKSLHEAQLDAKDLELREEGWRAALEKSDMTIKHQAETIAQLRNEVDQWKTQLTRLEESTRQEIDDWKEQYRRAEQERSRLSARIEDLIAGQLAWNPATHAYTTPYTPRVAYTEIPEPSASTSAPKRASAAQRIGGTPRRTARAPPDEDQPPPPTARKAKTAAAQSSRNAVQRDSDQQQSRGGSPVRSNAPRRKDQGVVEAPRAGGSSRNGPRTPASRLSSTHRDSQVRTEPTQRVIRRVTAIVDVDVKEEETDAEGLDDRGSARSGSVYEPDDDPPAPPGNRKRRKSNVSSWRKQVVQDWDEDEETPDVENDGETDQFEDDPAEEDEDDDDELLLGPKKRTSTKPRTSVAGKPSGGGKSLKRKVDGGGGVSGRTAPAKAARLR